MNAQLSVHWTFINHAYSYTEFTFLHLWMPIFVMRKVIQRQKPGSKLYKVWTDFTGFDFPGHSKTSSLFLHLPVHCTHLSEKISSLLYMDSWRLRAWASEYLPSELRSSGSCVRALVPVETCLILQTTLTMHFWPDPGHWTWLTLQLWLLTNLLQGRTFTKTMLYQLITLLLPIPLSRWFSTLAAH